MILFAAQFPKCKAEGNESLQCKALQRKAMAPVPLKLGHIVSKQQSPVGTVNLRCFIRQSDNTLH